MSKRPTSPAQSEPRLLGAHMPTAGGLAKALTGGREIGCSAVQLFTSNPRQWNAPPLTPEQIADFRAAHAETGIAFVVAHDSYLINLAAPDPEVHARSMAAFRREIEDAAALGIPWVVTHMGAHLNSGEEAGLAKLTESIRRVLAETEGCGTGVALETTAGQGTCLGYRFEHLARVLDEAGTDHRLSVCFDTCHALAAGYELRNAEDYAATWDEFDRLIGIENLSVIHANDAKKGLGSRVDRHEHLGKGELGVEVFRRLVNDPTLRQVPIVIETPEAEKMHATNLAVLMDLAVGGVGRPKARSAT